MAVGLEDVPADVSPRGPEDSAPLHPRHPVLNLQRRIGNQALQRLLQWNAEEPRGNSTAPGSTRFGHGFGRIPLHAGVYTESQPRLTIGNSCDVHEQEADRVAKLVMRMPDRQPQRACCPRVGKCPRCWKGQRRHENLQTKLRQPCKTPTTGVPSIVGVTLRSPGEPLDAGTRTFFEPRFGHDFSKVRVHTGARAAESARGLNAMAYTIGRDVVFGADRYRPHTSSGRLLLAHELAHVVQQAGVTPASHAGGAPMLRRAPLGVQCHPLTIKSKKPRQGRCGNFRWIVEWVLNNADKKPSGFIVQEVGIAWRIENCKDEIEDLVLHYWETWEVTGGTIESKTGTPGDEWSAVNTNGFKGMILQYGYAKLMQDYKEPYKWKRGTVKEAMSMRATKTEPPGWSTAESVSRIAMVEEFFCCEGKYEQSDLITTVEYL